MNLKTLLKDLLPYCQNCREVPTAQLFCENCLEDLSFDPRHHCVRCGGEIGALRKCTNCKSHKRVWDEIQILFKYEGGVKTWLNEAKNEMRPQRFREIERSHLPPLKFKYDSLLYIPSDPSQWSQRLHESSYELALHLAKLLGLKLEKDVFTRLPFLGSQKALDLKQRQFYLNQTLLLNPRAVERLKKWKRVLIVDDVMTTGASLQIASQLIRKEGPRVGVLCVARVLKDSAR